MVHRTIIVSKKNNQLWLLLIISISCVLGDLESIDYVIQKVLKTKITFKLTPPSLDKVSCDRCRKDNNELSINCEDNKLLTVNLHFEEKGLKFSLPMNINCSANKYSETAEISETYASSDGVLIKWKKNVVKALLFHFGRDGTWGNVSSEPAFARLKGLTNSTAYKICYAAVNDNWITGMFRCLVISTLGQNESIQYTPKCNSINIPISSGKDIPKLSLLSDENTLDPHNSSHKSTKAIEFDNLIFEKNYFLIYENKFRVVTIKWKTFEDHIRLKSANKTIIIPSFLTKNGSRATVKIFDEKTKALIRETNATQNLVQFEKYNLELCKNYSLQINNACFQQKDIPYRPSNVTIENFIASNSASNEWHISWQVVGYICAGMKLHLEIWSPDWQNTCLSSVEINRKEENHGTESNTISCHSNETSYSNKCFKYCAIRMAYQNEFSIKLNESNYRDYDIVLSSPTMSFESVSLHLKRDYSKLTTAFYVFVSLWFLIQISVVCIFYRKAFPLYGPLVKNDYESSIEANEETETVVLRSPGPSPSAMESGYHNYDEVQVKNLQSNTRDAQETQYLSLRFSMNSVIGTISEVRQWIEAKRKSWRPPLPPMPKFLTH